MPPASRCCGWQRVKGHGPRHGARRGRPASSAGHTGVRWTHAVCRREMPGLQQQLLQQREGTGREAPAGLAPRPLTPMHESRTDPQTLHPRLPEPPLEEETPGFPPEGGVETSKQWGEEETHRCR